MRYSNTSLNTYTTCQRKFWHNYVNHSPKCKPNPLYFAFGEMAHKVLKDAGDLRDFAESGIIDYTQCIPSEVLYSELKEEFRIKNWHSYFTAVCKQVAFYEKEELMAMTAETGQKCTIYRELQINSNIPVQINGKYERDEFITGIIDLLILSEDKKYATILDYKFSSTIKTQDDFDMNSQLQLYALLVHNMYGTPLRNIKIGYIDIVRADFERPTVLTNGQLSRAKSQNTSQEMYIACVRALWPDKADELLAPGGYYYDIVQELANRKIAYLNSQWLDEDTYNGIIHDVVGALLEVSNKINHTASKNAYCARYDAYTCKGCEFLEACKPWIKKGGFE